MTDAPNPTDMRGANSGARTCNRGRCEPTLPSFPPKFLILRSGRLCISSGTAVHGNSVCLLGLLRADPCHDGLPAQTRDGQSTLMVSTVCHATDSTAGAPSHTSLASVLL